MQPEQNKTVQTSSSILNRKLTSCAMKRLSIPDGYVRKIESIISTVRSYRRPLQPSTFGLMSACRKINQIITIQTGSANVQKNKNINYKYFRKITSYHCKHMHIFCTHTCEPNIQLHTQLKHIKVHINK